MSIIEVWNGGITLSDKPFLPSDKNPLRIYTELMLAPDDQPLILKELAGLGPTKTIEQLTRMWIETHHGVEWTIFHVDPMDFVDTVTAVTVNRIEKDHYGNYKSWTRDFAEKFAQGVINTTGKLLIISGLRTPESIPYFWHFMDRTVIVQAPDSVQL